MLTKEQYEQIDKHISTMKLIITNKSMSSVPIEYRETMNRIGKQLGYNYCPTCNAGLYNLTAQLYNKYLEYRSNVSNKNAKTKEKTKKTSNTSAESNEARSAESNEARSAESNEARSAESNEAK